VLIIMGPVALAWSLWTGARVIGAANWKFTGPGGAAVQITSPGTYSLWRTLARDESAPIPEGIRIVIVEPTRGEEFELEPLMGAPERIGSRVRAEIARATLSRPGPYEIDVSGDFPPGLYEFGPSTGPGLAAGGLITPRLLSGSAPGVLTLSTLLFGALSIIGIITGVAVLVTVWIARDRAGVTAAKTPSRG